MGTQKVLLPFAGKTIIEHIVDQLLAADLERVLVVVGYQAERVIGQLAQRDVSVVANPDYQVGMLSSIRCGFAALPEHCKAALVALGDQPTIEANLVNRMLGAFAETGKGLVVPVYRGKRGHPTLVSTSYRDEIMTGYDKVGLRGLLHAHPDDVFELAVTTPAILCDMDDPQDYQQGLTRFEENS